MIMLTANLELYPQFVPLPQCSLAEKPLSFDNVVNHQMTKTVLVYL